MRRIGRVLLPVLFWLGVWQLAAAAVGQELLLPGPAAVGRRLLELAAGAVFWQTALASLLRIFGGDPENKVHLLLDYTDHPHEIADPWYTRDFRKAEAEINEGCAALLRTLRARDN